MVAMMRESKEQQETAHQHAHAPNRFAVAPTAARLDASLRYSGKGVTIAFLDSGFYPHADLTTPRNRILAYHDITRADALFDKNAPAHPWQWHGTQTSVVAAGNGQLADSVYRGLAADADVVLVKVSDHGSISDKNIERGIRWVIDNRERYRIRILNISLGGDADLSYNDSAVDRAAADAVRAGMVVVVAAGNSGCAENPRPIPPANSPAVITVGGYNDNNQLRHAGRWEEAAEEAPELYCSNYGWTVDGLLKPEIIAPAMWVAAPILPNTEAYKEAAALSHLAAAPDYLLDDLRRLAADPEYLLSDMAHSLWSDAGLSGELHQHSATTIRALVEARLRDHKIIATHYQHVDGTSFAAPIVASVIAQMLEANPQLTPAAVKDLLVTTAERLPNADALRQGFGLLNARRAVERAARETHRLDDADATTPHLQAGRLVFTYHNDDADEVVVVGDFNDWNPARTPLRQDADGLWRAAIAPPPPGSYRYKFILNRVRWVEDPANPLKESDEFGGLNSVLRLA